MITSHIFNFVEAPKIQNFKYPENEVFFSLIIKNHSLYTNNYSMAPPLTPTYKCLNILFHYSNFVALGDFQKL